MRVVRPAGVIEFAYKMVLVAPVKLYRGGHPANGWTASSEEVLAYQKSCLTAPKSLLSPASIFWATNRVGRMDLSVEAVALDAKWQALYPTGRDR